MIQHNANFFFFLFVLAFFFVPVFVFVLVFVSYFVFLLLLFHELKVMSPQQAQLILMPPSSPTTFVVCTSKLLQFIIQFKVTFHPNKGLIIYDVTIFLSNQSPLALPFWLPTFVRVNDFATKQHILGPRAFSFQFRCFFYVH